MFNIKAMKAFVEVARLGSFAAAADSMKVSTTSLSRLVADLEAWLDAPLLRRSTRQVTLTDVGADYLDKCQSIVTAWEELGSDARRRARQPTGMLTVAGAAYSVRHLLAPHLSSFMRAFPEVKVKFDLRNDPVDLVSESSDVAFRLGEPKDASLVVTKCGAVRLALAAAPDLINQHGMPQNLDDLARFPCVLDTTPSGQNHWPGDGKLKIDYHLEANDGEIIRLAMVGGIGASMVPRFLIETDIKAGRLVEICPEANKAELGVYFVLPERRQITGAARAFVDFMAGRVRKALD
ncbi:MAG: LysR family transcriptional regulator [Pseudomonadota bacterium]